MPQTRLSRLPQSAASLRRARERRAGKRYLAPLVWCDVLQPQVLLDAAVVNLSAQGACIAVPISLPPPTVLHLRLSNREQLCAHVVALRVTHCRGRMGSLYPVGGPFEQPLPIDVLSALLT